MLSHTISPVASAAHTYFAGSNTASGFVSRYGDIFTESDLDSLIIIKGGPGTGKNTFMRRLCDRAAASGITVHAYLCGSDPDSLDALVLRRGKKSAAVIDATVPHPFDARYPGSVSQILDLGRFWDKSRLRAMREEIAAHTEAKSQSYTRAYRYLAALAAVRRDRRIMSEKALDRDKMKAACDRFAASLDRFAPVAADTPSLPHIRIASAASMDGFCALDICQKYTRVNVSDPDSAAPAFLASLAASFATSDIRFAEVRDAVEPDVIRGLVLDERRLYIAPLSDASPAKTVNLARFLSRDILRDNRNKRTFARRVASAMEDGAADALADAGKHHFALEAIYKSAMDFDALNDVCDKQTDDILAVFD